MSAKVFGDFRRANVDRILRDGDPADLPLQAPTKNLTVVNLNTAKALGLDVRRHCLFAAMGDRIATFLPQRRMSAIGT